MVSQCEWVVSNQASPACYSDPTLPRAPQLPQEAPCGLQAQQVPCIQEVRGSQPLSKVHRVVVMQIRMENSIVPGQTLMVLEPGCLLIFSTSKVHTIMVLDHSYGTTAMGKTKEWNWNYLSFGNIATFITFKRSLWSYEDWISTQQNFTGNLFSESRIRPPFLSIQPKA